MLRLLRLAAFAAMSIACVTGSAVFAQEATPHRGGSIRYVVQADPNTYDCHATATAFDLQLLSQHYSTLLRYDTAHYPAIVGDLAEDFSVSDDGLSYHFTLRPDITFHDGSPLTSADVAASYERLRNPPEGVTSARKIDFADIKAIETPDARTVVFTLSQPNGAMLSTFASPWNCVYSKALMASDPNYPAKRVMGSGAFRFVAHNPGANWTGERFDGFYVKGKPYLDSFEAVFLTGPGVMNALLGGQVDAFFNSIMPADRQRLEQALGDRIAFAVSDLNILMLATLNTTKPPFDDARVRRAFNIAVDRHQGAKVLSQISNLDSFGTILRPGHPFGSAPEAWGKLPGNGEDIAAAREEAKELLKEAGVSNLKLEMLSRNIRLPWEVLGVFLIDQWRQIGVQVDQNILEAGPYFTRLKNKDYDLAIDFNTLSGDEPSEALAKFLPTAANNYSGFADQRLTELYAAQKAETDRDARRRLIAEFEQRVIDDAANIPLFWGKRTSVLKSDIKGWHVTPSFVVGNRLDEVWLAR